MPDQHVSMTKTGTITTALGLLALYTQACSFDLMEPIEVLVNTCETDIDCPGARCEGGICVAPSAAPFEITLEVTPASADFGVDPPTIVLPAFVVGDVDERTISVPDPALVFGDVRADTKAIAVEIRFTPMTGTQTLTPRPIIATAPDGSATDSVGQPADYSVSLLRDTEYRVTVVPADSATYPPLHLALAADSTADRRFDVVFDSSTFFTQAIEVLDLPDGSWSIVAVDPATGADVSTRATLSIDNTFVVLKSAAPFLAFDVVVAPLAGPDVTESRPTFQIPHTMLTAANNVSKLQLPKLASVVSFTGIVEHCRDLTLEPDVQSRPAMAAALRSRSLFTLEGLVADAGTFTTTATALYDSALGEWNFSAQVPPGRYDVVVTPTAEADCGVFAESREIQAPSQANAGTAALLQLPSLSFLGGRVRVGGSMSIPVMGATVVANGLGLRDTIAFEPNDSTVTRYNRSQQTSTDDLGEFTLPIDVGAYDVIVKPPPDSGFAWHVLRDVNVGARTDTPFDREINLAAPVQLRVMLQTLNGLQSMSGATVRAYTTTTDAERGERALPIGAAVVGDQGEFMLLLPAAIGQGWY